VISYKNYLAKDSHLRLERDDFVDAVNFEIHEEQCSFLGLYLEEWLTVSLNYFDKNLGNFPGFHYTSFFAIHYFVIGGAVIHDGIPGSYLVTPVSPYIAMNHELIHDNLNLLKRFVERHLLPSFQVIFFLRGLVFEFYMDYMHRQVPSPYQLVYLVQRAGYSHSFYLTISSTDFW